MLAGRNVGERLAVAEHRNRQDQRAVVALPAVGRVGHIVVEGRAVGEVDEVGDQIDAATHEGLKRGDAGAAAVAVALVDGEGLADSWSG